MRILKCIKDKANKTKAAVAGFFATRERISAKISRRQRHLQMRREMREELEQCAKLLQDLCWRQ